MKKITPKVFVVVVLCAFNLFAQKTTHEIGIFAGATAIQTDFDKSGQFLSTFANNSKTIGVSHYSQFFDSNAPWRQRYGIFDHLMVKTELSFTQTADLEHYGVYVNNQSSKSSTKKVLSTEEVLKNMVGKINMLNLGFNLEYYLMDLTRFFYHHSKIKINPFISFGINYAFFHNKVYSKLGDWQENNNLFPDQYLENGALDLGFGSSLAYNFGIGTRLNLTESFDFSAQVNWQIFMSDAVDGIQANIAENKSTETMTSIQLGVVYHLNFFKSM